MLHRRMTPEEEVVALKAENAAQRQRLDLLLEQNALLAERVRELEARLAKDSHNSHKPPRATGSSANCRGPGACVVAAGSSPVDSQDIPARRCIWWRLRR